VAEKPDRNANTQESAAARREAEIMDVTPHKHEMLPVWFFIGVILVIYGVLIFATGLYEYSNPPKANFHASVWWGIILAAVGAVFVIQHYPRKR
jgi:FtsH-binding integral membrane protein